MFNLIEFRGHVSSESLSLHDLDVILTTIAAALADSLKKSWKANQELEKYMHT